MICRKAKPTEAHLERALTVTRRVMLEQGLQGKPSLDDSLDEDGLGLSSMGRLELLTAMEEEFKTSIPEAYWGTKRIANLRELAAIVSRK